MSWSEALLGLEPSELPLGDVPIDRWQQDQIAAAGLAASEVELGPGVVASAGYLQALAEAAAESGGSARAVTPIEAVHDEFGANTLAELDRTPTTLGYDLAVGGPTGAARPALIDQLDVAASSPQPGRMADPIRTFAGDRFVWRIAHWWDLLVVNLLVAQTRAATAGPTTIDPSAEVHPTAVVDHSTIGPGARIGPFAVVARSEVGADAVVAEQTSVRDSLIGEGTVVQAQSLVVGSVVGPAAVLSFHTAVRGSLVVGHSTISAPVVARSVIGSETFLARSAALGATTLADTPVTVRVGRRSCSTGAHLVGCCLGRGARIGNGISIPAGYTVPAGAHLVDRPLPRIQDDLADGATLLLDGGRFRNLPTLKGMD